ncbi:MAG: hypothetical protein WKG52_11000 [Variovorax sp.]
MLTPFLKAEILRKTGFAVPALPTEVLEVTDGRAATKNPDNLGESHVLKQWVASVEALFVTYVAARAAKSLRDAEEARQLDALQRMSASYSARGLQSLRA